MDIEDIPVIDWEEAIRLAGNKRELAEEMLDMLVKTLPGEMELIQSFHETQNYPGLLRQVHKLHGAVCYCGVPRLKSVLSRLETQLKSNIMDGSSSLLDQLNAEVKLLLETPPPTRRLK